jgi:predicted PurR-regulated permease PerM
MKNKLTKIGVGAAMFLLPAVAFAQYSITNSNTLFSAIESILNAVIPIIIALAVVYILWGIVQSFVRGSEDERKAGHMKILYGIIALFIMISIWGLVNILVNTTNLNNNIPTNQIPNLNNLPTNQ